MYVTDRICDNADVQEGPFEDENEDEDDVGGRGVE